MEVELAPFDLMPGVQLGLDDLGDVPPGTTISTFIVSGKGYVLGSNGELILAHDKDNVALSGGKSGIQIHRVKKTRKRTRGRGPLGMTYGDWSGWSAWKESPDDVTIRAGQTLTITNTEGTDAGVPTQTQTDTDTILTLTDVIKTAEEVEAERKQADLDKVLKDPNATPEARELAKKKYDAAAAAAEAAGAGAGLAAMQSTIATLALPLGLVAVAGVGIFLTWHFLGRRGG